jgi:hypothetical protein
VGLMSRVNRFETWLRERGTADVFDRAIVERLIAIAGARPVSADHVETAIERTPDANTTIAIEQLGKLLIRCESLRDHARSR